MKQFSFLFFLFIMIVSLMTNQGFGQTTKPSSLFFCLYQAPPPSANKRAYPTYQGLAFSSDKGETWKTVGWLTSGSNSIDRDPLDDDVYFLATEYGLMKSTNKGFDWKVVTEWNIGAVTQVKALPNLIWIGTTDGLYRSTDGGDTWTQSKNGLPVLDGTLVNDFLILTDTLLVATDAGIFRSVDSGKVWTPYGLNDNKISHLARGAGQSANIAAISDREGIWLSPDGGATWEVKSKGLLSSKLQAVVFHPLEQSTIFVGTQDIGIMKSTDGGSTWVNVSSGLQNFNIISIAFDRDDPKKIYAGAENGAFVSKDGGRMWDHSTLKQGWVSAIRMF